MIVTPDSYIAGVGVVISLVSYHAFTNRRDGSRDQMINDHETRITKVEDTVEDHHSRIGSVEGELKRL